MAERRMFAKSVVESDNFLDMPAEAQALYFHLNMAADDYGFCDNPRSIMRACGAGNDTMKLLIAKKFVLAFDKNDGFVIVVKHWRINNYIREDRKHETKYKELMRDLYYDENNSYSTNPNDGHYPCLGRQLTDNCPTTDGQLTDTCHTEVRLGKDSVGKESKGKSREEKDNNSLSKIEEIGESEGEEQTAAPAFVLSGEEREKRIAELRDSAQRFINLGFPPDSIYCLAQAEGIDPKEITTTKKG